MWSGTRFPIVLVPDEMKDPRSIGFGSLFIRYITCFYVYERVLRKAHNLGIDKSLKNYYNEHTCVLVPIGRTFQHALKR